MLLSSLVTICNKFKLLLVSRDIMCFNVSRSRKAVELIEPSRSF